MFVLARRIFPNITVNTQDLSNCFIADYHILHILAGPRHLALVNSKQSTDFRICFMAGEERMMIPIAGKL